MQNAMSLEHDNNKINWNTLVFVTLFHVVAVAAFFTFSWSNLFAFLFLWWFAGSLGVGIGYHRLLTHRGFKAPKWLEYTLSTIATLALQSGPLTWVTTHRVHHAFTETERDPHSPRFGTYWSHMGWIMRGKAQQQTWADMQRYCPDFANDRFHQWINKYYFLPIIIVAAALFAIGGWSMVVWGVFVKTVVGWHFTWLVNSATHLWGTRRFDTRDDSRNNALVAALTWGEGWHNNHHAFPRSAKHGLAWYEIDINWITIRLFEMTGLITDVYAYSEKKEKNRIQADATDLVPSTESA